MPHLIVEYSGNVERRVDVDALLERLHREALDTGVFAIGGLRVRAYRAEHYRIGDLDPENAFVHVTALIGHGRALDVRRRAGERLFAALTDELAEAFEQGPLAISFDIREFHPELSFKQNNLHRYAAARRDAAEAARATPE